MYNNSYNEELVNISNYNHINYKIKDLKFIENMLFVTFSELDFNYNYNSSNLLKPLIYTLFPINKNESNKNKLDVFPNNILKIEELDKDFNSLIKQYKLKIPLNITKTTKINITFGNIKPSDLNKESIELINKIYHYDFKFFNYQKL